MSNCDSIWGWLSITHALSLVDTYWVKLVGSDLSCNVSLYTHKFNKQIAKAAFDGELCGYGQDFRSFEYLATRFPRIAGIL